MTPKTVILKGYFYIVKRLPIYELKTKSMIFVINVPNEKVFEYVNVDYKIANIEGKICIFNTKIYKTVKIGRLRDKNYFQKATLNIIYK